MNGIYVINKPKNITSRDVVNVVSKKLKIKKVGHTGTLDPIATGVLVVCVGSACKLVESLTSLNKEYIATAELGVLTDTLDNTGKIIQCCNCIISKEKIFEVLNSFKKSYEQEVPLYSSIKINGKKLYEYARSNINVELPKRLVEIQNIELLGDVIYSNNKTIFKFKCKVSKGTYIRSLIRDIAFELNTIGIMTDLIRTKQGNFTIEDSIELDEISDNSLKSIIEVLNVEKVVLSSELEKKVLNGAKIDNNYSNEKVLFIKNNEAVALYKKQNDIYIIEKMF